MQNQWLHRSLGMFDGVTKSSFRTLSFPQVHVEKKRACNMTRPNPSVAVQVSSIILLQTKEGGEVPKQNQIPGPFASPEKCRTSVGIIGGVSVLSTLIFLKKLVWKSSKNGGDSVPFIVCSDPAINRLIHVPVFCKKDEINQSDSHLVIENLKKKRLFLEQSGASCIVMPCHMSHLWYPEVSLGCSVPFLNVGDCVARALKEAKFRQLEIGSRVQIGVLANNLMAPFYKKKLQSQGFEVVLPDKSTIEHAVLPALEAFNKKDIEGAQNLLRIAVHLLLMKAVNTVILAGDEFRDILPPKDPLLKRCIDPMDVLVRSTISWERTSHKAVSHHKI